MYPSDRVCPRPPAAVQRSWPPSPHPRQPRTTWTSLTARNTRWRMGFPAAGCSYPSVQASGRPTQPDVQLRALFEHRPADHERVSAELLVHLLDHRGGRIELHQEVAAISTSRSSALNMPAATRLNDKNRRAGQNMWRRIGAKPLTLPSYGTAAAAERASAASSRCPDS